MVFSVQDVVDAITSVTGGKAPLHAPEINGNEWEYVKDCLDTGWVSTAGSYVGKFESMLCEFTGANHAIATVNGTSALHTCLLLVGVGSGDEVISPSLTFVATANAIAYCGATPHFADIEESTLGLDAAALDQHLRIIGVRRNGGLFNRETGRRIKAVICMHTLGHPCDVDALLEVCNRYGLFLIEDAAESLGSFRSGRHTGNWGLVSALSFNGNKIVTAGGGGAILTNDNAIAEKAKHLTTTAKIPHSWDFIHDQIGYNYRLPNVNAAIGCAQLEQLDDMLARKKILSFRYQKAFEGIGGIHVVGEPESCKSNFWLNALLLDSEHETIRNEILKKTNDNGVMTRPAWVPMHHLEMFQAMPRMKLDVTESIARRLIDIPSSAMLGDKIV